MEDSDSDAELLEIYLRQDASHQQFAIERKADLPAGPEDLQAPPSIALLDLNLPGSRGQQTLELFRQRLPEVPVIVLTGLGDEELTRQALRAGAQDYFEKDRLETLPLWRLINFAIERFQTQAELQRLNANLESQRDQFNDILESTSDGIVAVDHHGIVRFANSASLSLLGRTESETVGRRLPISELVGEDGGEIRLDLGQGAFRYLQCKVNPARWRGEAHRLLTIRDVTETKIYQDMLIQTERQNLVDQLSAAVAHEFNNALAIIRMTVELLLAHPVSPEEQREHLEVLLGEVERSLALVGKLTSLSREDDPALESTNLAAFLDEHRTIYSKTLGSACGLKIEVEDAEPEIEADASQLHQIFVNLLVNAAHAMRESGGDAAIRVTPFNPADRKAASNAPEGYVCVEVSDSGSGMDAATRERIFEPFYTTKPKGEGTGLGLALVTSIVNRHKGWMECDSAPGEGTTFRLYFPRCTMVVNEAGMESRPLLEIPPTHLAVVDDNELLLNLLQEGLTARGHRVQCFREPEALLDAVDDGYEPEVLLSDMVMPGLSGLTLIERLRERSPGLRCAIMSGYNLEGVRGRLPEGCGIELLGKPFTNDQLMVVLAKLLKPEAGAPTN
ncbi:MAG: response regulator [Opitutales bacterium]